MKRTGRLGRMNGWLLLIYTLPSQPSRKRAYVWRELKRLGAVYLRDGVAVLPSQGGLKTRLTDVAERIDGYEGTVDLIDLSAFPPDREAQLVTRFNEERASEYRELHHACVRFLRDVLHDVDAEDFGFPDVDKLESELGRLTRWYQQVQERDYFGGAGGERVAEILAKCEKAFDHFVHEASERQADGSERQPEDVFQRLSGSADTPGGDYPI
jgi:hypothetical protein